MKSRIDEAGVERLMKAGDYRSFVRVWMKERSRERRFGFSDIARVGGFAARSFPRDVVNGHKRLTLNSLAKFARGLGLTKELSDYFRLLVEMEQADCRTRGGDLQKLKTELERTRERIL